MSLYQTIMKKMPSIYKEYLHFNYVHKWNTGRIISNLSPGIYYFLIDALQYGHSMYSMHKTWQSEFQTWCATGSPQKKIRAVHINIAGPQLENDWFRYSAVIFSFFHTKRRAINTHTLGTILLEIVSPTAINSEKYIFILQYLFVQDKIRVNVFYSTINFLSIFL